MDHLIDHPKLSMVIQDIMQTQRPFHNSFCRFYVDWCGVFMTYCHLIQWRYGFVQQGCFSWFNSFVFGYKRWMKRWMERINVYALHLATFIYSLHDQLDLVHKAINLSSRVVRATYADTWSQRSEVLAYAHQYQAIIMPTSCPFGQQALITSTVSPIQFCSSVQSRQILLSFNTCCWTWQVKIVAKN